jgi:pilus assembly protein CpaB
VVASSALAYGSKIDAAHLTIAQFPVGSAPQGAYSSVSQVIGPNGAPIVLVPISAREPVLPTKLSNPGAKSTVAAIISEGMRAYTIGVNDVAGGGGHVLPGDRVDVVLTQDLAQTGGEASAGSGKRLVSNVVIQNVRVLGMDLNADPSTTQAAIAHTATLEVSVDDAEKLALAAQAGTMSLALRRTGSAEIAPVRVLRASDLGVAGAVRPATLTQVHRRGGKSAPAPIHRSIIVVHGDAKASVEVPSERGSGV